jgi:glycosyltransferase involved in cell wall biosynthesis
MLKACHTYEIGVAIPTLNSAKFLEWTFLSLLNQHQCSVQIMVVDSGSTDGTLEICKRWNIKTLYVPPGNLYDAVNTGIRTFQTKWVTYLNSNDTVYCDSYARMIAAGDENEADVVYGHVDFIDEENRYLYKQNAAPVKLLMPLAQSLLMGFAQPASIFRKDIYDALGGFSEKYRIIADFDFFTRALMEKSKFYSLPHPSAACFRFHHGQLSFIDGNHKELEYIKSLVGYKKQFTNGIPSLVWKSLNARNILFRLLTRASGSE